MTTRIRYLATTPFSHRREQSTTKYASTYPSPTPYAVRVALTIGAIRVGMNPNEFFEQVRTMPLTIHPYGEGVMNTHMVKHMEVPHSDSKDKFPAGYYSSTVVFREYLYFNNGGIALFVPTESIEWLKPVLPAVNSFGKQGSFFVLEGMDEKEAPSGNQPFVGSDVKSNASWEQISSFSPKSGNVRVLNQKYKLPVYIQSGGKGFVHLKFLMTNG